MQLKVTPVPMPTDLNDDQWYISDLVKDIVENTLDSRDVISQEDYDKVMAWLQAAEGIVGVGHEVTYPIK